MLDLNDFFYFVQGSIGAGVLNLTAPSRSHAQPHISAFARRTAVCPSWVIFTHASSFTTRAVVPPATESPRSAQRFAVECQELPSLPAKNVV
jgi:hypothetical protein